MAGNAVQIKSVLLYANDTMIASLKRVINQKVSLDRAIISDFALWFLLAFLLAYGVYLFAIAIPAKRGQTIILHFRDANEISKGSPVRMMGTEIGFVDDVHIRRDHVDIKVQTNPGTLRIPSGSTFTILFTGLAGAKSIEVDLPKTPQPVGKDGPIYLVEEPIRMKDTLNASIDVIQALQKGAENITDFFGKRKPVEELQFNIRQAYRMSAIAGRNTTALNQAILKLQHDITDNTLEAIDTLGGLNHASRQLAQYSQPTTLRRDINDVIGFGKKLAILSQSQSQGAINTIRLSRRLTRINQHNAHLNRQIHGLIGQVRQAPLKPWLDNLYKQGGQFSTFLDQADAYFSTDHMPALRHARQAIQDFNLNLERLNQKLNQVQVNQTSHPKQKP